MLQTVAIFKEVSSSRVRHFSSFFKLTLQLLQRVKDTTKKDSKFSESDNHPDLSDLKAPKTDTASRYRKKSSSKSDNDSNSDP